MKKFIIIQQLDGSEQHLVDTHLPIVIGSGEDAHLKLPGVDTPAALIGEDQGHLFIQPAPNKIGPVFHNDVNLEVSAWLKSKDQIRIGRYLIFYESSGDRIVLLAAEAPDHPLQHAVQPPLQPPPESSDTTENNQQIPVEMAEEPPTGRKRNIVIGIVTLLFLGVGLGVLFVLTARPLGLMITPEPDNVSISGFPPAVTFGSHYLLIPGTYKLTAEKEGYVPLSTQVAISKSEENHLSATLEKLPGILELSVTPDGSVTIYSGDHLVGSTPPDSIEIAPGQHNLKLVRERYQPFFTEMDIEGKGIIQSLEAQLLPDWADITFLSKPDGARISIDNRPVGTTPLTLQLLSGSHTITLEKQLFTDSSRTVSVVAGRSEEHVITMQPLPGEISIASTPGQAAVLIDRIYRGTTPLTVAVAPDKEHDVVVSLQGYESAEISFSVNPGEQRETEVKLKEQHGTIFLTISPPDGAVSLDGRVVASIPGEFSLPVRPHSLTVAAAGYKSQTRTILPKSGFSQQIAIELKPLPNTEVPMSPGNTLKSPISTSSDQVLLLVEPSAFSMGAPRREPGRRANEHERAVTMEKPFYLSRKLVTNREYRLFDPNHDSGSFAGASLGTDQQPVVNLTWEDAVKYLNWLSERDNLQPFYTVKGKSFTAVSPATKGYRLPTESEWAFSARVVGSPLPQRFPWNGGFPPRMATGNFADESARSILPAVINGYQDGFPVSSPVGSFPPNKGGFFDMGGNTSEWCHDFYSPFISSTTEQTDPLGPPSGTHHVVRGSNWRDASITELRLSFRGYHREARNNIGFRIARYP